MASEISKLEITTEVQCSPHKFYEMIKNTLHHLPNVVPDVIKSTEIVEGDGQSVGTVRLWKYVLPGTSEVLSAKEKIEVVDDENMWLILSMLEGDMTKHYKTFLVKVHVIPKDEGCSVKWSVEYGKAAEDVADPHRYLDLYAILNEKLSAHIIAKEM